MQGWKIKKNDVEQEIFWAGQNFLGNVQVFQHVWTTRIQISRRILKKTVWLVFETQVRNEYQERETIRSVFWSVFFCWNNIILRINITSRISKKTVRVVSETQIRNEYMEQETIRSVLWSVFFAVIFQWFWASWFLHNLGARCFPYNFGTK